MSRNYLRSLKPIAGLALATQLWSNMALSNEFDIARNEAPPLATFSNKIHGVQSDYRSINIKGLTRTEQDAAIDAHNKLYEAALSASEHHVNAPDAHELMHGYDYLNFVSKLDQNKEYSRQEIFNLIAVDIDQMLTNLDPHSKFLTEDQAQQFMMSMNDQSNQMGLKTTYTRRGLEITHITTGSAAEKAGLIEGDIITKINGRYVRRLDIEMMRTLFEQENSFSLKIRRSGRTLNEPVNFEKAPISVSTVDSYILNNNIAYIAISRFSNNTHDDFRSALESIIDESDNMIKGVIIDLYYNGGGSKKAVLNIADDLTRQDALLRTRDKNGEHIHTGDSNHQITDLPIVVLINNFSASAAEVLAGILKDYKRATIIGDGASYGKATIQTHKTFSFYSPVENAGLVLTTSHVLLPVSGSYQYHGIQPDILVPRNTEEQRMYNDFKGPKSVRDYSNHLITQGSHEQDDPSYSCTVTSDKSLVNIYNMHNGSIEYDVDLSDNAPVLCAIDHLSSKPEPQYTETTLNSVYLALR